MEEKMDIMKVNGGDVMPDMAEVLDNMKKSGKFQNSYFAAIARGIALRARLSQTIWS